MGVNSTLRDTMHALGGKLRGSQGEVLWTGGLARAYPGPDEVLRWDCSDFEAFKVWAQAKGFTVSGIEVKRQTAPPQDRPRPAPAGEAKEQPLSPNGAFALAWAEVGLPVHPCKESGPKGVIKAPYLPADPDRNGKTVPRTGGVYKASADPRLVEERWKAWPGAIPGLQLRDYIVVDCDMDPGDGVAEFEAIRQRLGVELPNGTPVIATPSGGRHFLLGLPPGPVLKKRPKGTVSPSIDVLTGVGCYIIAPRSKMADGQTYEPLPGSPDPLESVRLGKVPVAPDWLINLCWPQEPDTTSTAETIDLNTAPRQEGSGFGFTADQESVRHQANAWHALAGRAGDFAAMPPDSGRDSFLMKAVGYLAPYVTHGFLTRDEMFSRFMQAAAANGLVAKNGREAVESTYWRAFDACKNRPLPDLRDRAYAESGSRAGAGWRPQEDPTPARGEPLPLFPEQPSARAFPLHRLGPLEAPARAIASKVQVPDAMAVNSVLGTASLATQGLGDVLLPYGDQLPLSLYLITIAGSGDRKSATDKAAMRGVRMRVREMQDEFKQASLTYKNKRAAWGFQRKGIEKKAEKGIISAEDLESQLAALGPEPDAPLRAFLTAPDPTIEGLLKGWPVAPAALGLFTDEGGQLIGGFGFAKENALKTAAALSSLWGGTPVERLRASDIEPTLLYGRRLSMHLMIQPEAGLEFLSNPVLRNQGFLARFLVAAPDSIAGERLKWGETWEEQNEIRRFADRVLALLNRPLPLREGTRNELEPPTLTFTAKAEKHLRDFYFSTEKAQKRDNLYADMKSSASKATEQAARIAGVLTLFENPEKKHIEESVIADAIAITEWYLDEALRIAGLAPADPAVENADKLEAWARKKFDCEPIDLRYTLRNANPKILRKKAVAEEAIKTLVEHRRAVWLNLDSWRLLPQGEA